MERNREKPGDLDINCLLWYNYNMIMIPKEIRARYKPASLPASKPENQAFEDFLLNKMDEADVISELHPVTYSHEEVFAGLRKRYTEKTA
jgi:hypothetical protein